MVPLADVETLFTTFQHLAGDLAAARTRFQQLITELVGVIHPNANEVAGPGGGDWGIDTFVGSLAGDVFVWQSKFFPKWHDNEPQKQVRASFRQLMKKAGDEGVRVKSWTLCVPCILSPDQQKWFDGWKKRQETAESLVIDMWGGVRVRRHLMKPEAEHLLSKYFTPPSAILDYAPQDIAEIVDYDQYNDALFVRQLVEAGYESNDAARSYFFIAEALARDIAARGVRAEVQALREIALELHGLWESEFNARVSAANQDGRIAGLVDSVMLNAGGLTDPIGVKLRVPHKKGLAHRLVEDRRAGWVKHWRDIAVTHRAAEATPDDPEATTDLTEAEARA